jgi:undecaprenyl diphosphate synthase
VVELTKENTKGNLVLAISYGSQSEILNAVKNISSDVKEGKVEVENIDEKLFENYLYTKDFPPVDLLIRTSGEIESVIFFFGRILC